MWKSYNIKIPRDPARPAVRYLARDLKIPLKLEENLPATYQGEKVGSVIEARSIVALLYLKYAFTYQAVINGGRKVRGGQVIDFLIDTPVVKTAGWTNGEYWHGGRHTYEDEIKIRNAKVAFHGQLHTVVLWENQLQSVSQAISAWAGALR